MVCLNGLDNCNSFFSSPEHNHTVSDTFCNSPCPPRIIYFKDSYCIYFEVEIQSRYVILDEIKQLVDSLDSLIPSKIKQLLVEWSCPALTRHSFCQFVQIQAQPLLVHIECSILVSLHPNKDRKTWDQNYFLKSLFSLNPTLYLGFPRLHTADLEESQREDNLPGENIPSPSLLDQPTISLIFFSVICSMRTNTGAIS